MAVLQCDVYPLGRYSKFQMQSYKAGEEEEKETA